MGKYKRIFVIVMDSLGVGAMDDSPQFGDVDVNTLGHISQSVDSLCMPNLQKMGIAEGLKRFIVRIAMFKIIHEPGIEWAGKAGT